MFERILGSIHVHTSYSGGKKTPREVVELAREKGIRVVAITDYSDRCWEYHRIRINRASVLKYGLGAYFLEIASLAKDNDDIIVLPGLEVSPFYYWEGSFLKPVCRDYNRHIIVLGLEKVSDYDKLPILAKRSYGYDQYSGSQGIKPYQKLIDYVNRRSGMTFWAHPEMEDNFRYLNVRHYTPPYPEDLKKSLDYTGFCVLPRGKSSLPAPGGYWDQVLTEFCEKRRSNPVWCIAETDYRKDSDDISNPATVFVVPVNSKDDAISALRNGRVYALDCERRSMFLDYFGAVDAKTGESVSMGERLADVSSSVIIKVDIESANPLKKVVLVRDGIVVRESTDGRFQFEDKLPVAKKKFFYRLVAEDTQGARLFSNPIFIGD